MADDAVVSSRRWPWYIGLTVLTVGLGLLSRAGIVPLPGLLVTYGGDVLWAMLVFWLLCVAAPRRPGWLLALVALGFSLAVECSQLWHPQWLEALRGTRLGGLVLGYGFKWSDLVCYTIGVALGFALDRVMTRRRTGNF